MDKNILDHDLVFKQVLIEDYPKLSRRQISSMMKTKGYKQYRLNRLPKYIKKMHDLEGLPWQTKVYVKK